MRYWFTGATHYKIRVGTRFEFAITIFGFIIFLKLKPLILIFRFLCRTKQKIFLINLNKFVSDKEHWQLDY